MRCVVPRIGDSAVLGNGAASFDWASLKTVLKDSCAAHPEVVVVYVEQVRRVRQACGVGTEWRQPW